MSPTPTTQKAVVFEEASGPLTVKEVPVPVPGPDQVLVRILYSGVCHSDLHNWKGETPIRKLPCIGGHEGVGHVEKIGSSVVEFKVGDTVGVKWVNAACGNCEDCVKGFEEHCDKRTESGFNHDGTFQQFCLSSARHAHKIPEGIELAKAAPVLCAGLTVYRGLKESSVRPGEWVAITGAGGGLGSLAIQYAKAMGMRVVAIDVGEAKEKHCKSLGAEVFVDVSTSTSIRGDVIKATQGGSHGTLNIAPAIKAIEESFWYTRKRGTAVLIGIPVERVVSLNVLLAIIKVLTIKGTIIGSRQDTEEALNFVARGLVDVPIEVHPLAALPEIYDRLQRGDITGRAVLDLWK